MAEDCRAASEFWEEEWSDGSINLKPFSPEWFEEILYFYGGLDFGI